MAIIASRPPGPLRKSAPWPASQVHWRIYDRAQAALYLLGEEPKGHRSEDRCRPFATYLDEVRHIRSSGALSTVIGQSATPRSPPEPA